MAYNEFNISTPVATQTAVSAMESTKFNLNALRDAQVMGTFKGWNCYVGSPRDNPATIAYSKGDERIRSWITYGSAGVSDGLVSTIVHVYSSNAGSTFMTVGTETMTYDASSNLQNILWS